MPWLPVFRHNVPSYDPVILPHRYPDLPHRTLPSHLQAIRVGVDDLAVMRRFGRFGMGGRVSSLSHLCGYRRLSRYASVWLVWYGWSAGIVGVSWEHTHMIAAENII